MYLARSAPTRQKFSGSVTREINTYTWPSANTPSRLPSTRCLIESACVLCTKMVFIWFNVVWEGRGNNHKGHSTVKAYAGTTHSCSMIGSPRMFNVSWRAPRSIKSISGIISSFFKELSLQNLASRSEQYAGSARRLLSVVPGCQWSSLPCVPFANRSSTAIFEINMTRMRCGFEPRATVSIV